MGTCALVGAVDFNAEHLKAMDAAGAFDFVIAVDAGFASLEAIGREADMALGDFDSLGYVLWGSAGVPGEKDDSDSMLAVKRGLELGYRRFVLYGGRDGLRLDHTVANFLSLGYLASHGGFGFLVGREYLACAFRGGTLRLPAGLRGDFSLFCLGADALGVTIRGLHYEAEGVRLTADFPLGVSKHFEGRAASGTAAAGTLLARWQTQTPLPEYAAE